VGGHFGEVVEDGFGQRIEDVISTQRDEARRFIRWEERACGGSFQPVGDAMYELSHSFGPLPFYSTEVKNQTPNESANKWDPDFIA
jgi:hypothetical protein